MGYPGTLAIVAPLVVRAEHEHVFVYRRPTVENALRLAARGRNATEIGRYLGVPTRTVSNWLHGAIPGLATRYREVPVEEIVWGKLASYAYLLGLYLGDGYIARMPRTYCLRITLDLAYPQIIAAAAAAVDALISDGRSGTYPRTDANCCNVTSYSRFWPRLLPQHGPGPKHRRDVSLLPWQATITAEHPHEFIRGLIHSDGCRLTANQRRGHRTYSYARYCFDNKSQDILRIFCEHLDLLGIHWTRQRHDAVQIARREAVAQLDEFVGPKR